ncbi:MAG: Na+/H+ antiporter NhaA [Alphaproteobacteria bacterium]|nr:Na+/H+ antiporter NhaA [Alphaproteobacteria bacterium]
MPTRAITEFFRLESAGGLLLVAMVAVALILSNSPAADFYRSVIDLPMAAYAGGVGLEKMLVHWVNDGLMAVFFLLVGLEIKREIKDGELSSRDQVLLPAAAAVGGMAVLALVYVLFNMGDEIAMRGWAIPAATDIAFSLGVIALLGRRVPISLKVFLTALAILDDLGAIIIIAIFYTAELSAISLGVAGACVIVLIVLNRIGVERLSPYVLVGLVLWFAVLESGVHATLAGVLLGLCIPLHGRSGGDAASPLRQLEQRLHAWVAYLILPLFALLNAGVSFSGAESGGVFGAVPLGIALGLFVGKQVGVFGMAWLLIRFGICRLPEGANWKQLYGVAVLTEIGFTMSLFIGGLAFEPGTHESDVRIGVLMGSIVSAVTGYVLLRAAGRNEGAHRSSMA